MTPTQAMSDRLATLLATDASSLAPAMNALKVHLIKENFTPGPLTSFSDLTEADFTGSTAKSPTVGAQQQYKDPSDGAWVVRLIEPAGGWLWIATDAVNLPQTIYGYVVTNNDGTVTYGSALLSQPANLTAALQAVDVPEITFTFPPQPVS